MRYIGSILGAGLLAGVLSDGGAGGADIGTFRFVGLVVVATAALALVAAAFIHAFPDARAAGYMTVSVAGRCAVG